MALQAQVEPQNAEELQQLKQYIDRCAGLINELKARFDHITDSVALLSKFGFMPDQTDFESYWATYSWPQRVYQERPP